jgi:hypothetical protein
MKTMKKVLLTITLVLLLAMTVALPISASDNNDGLDYCTTEFDNKEINVNTTMYDCYDKEVFKGEVRLVQMFVTEVTYRKDYSNTVYLEDTKGEEWIVENVDLFLYEDVLVLMCDNNTPNDVTDDGIITFWVNMCY